MIAKVAKTAVVEEKRIMNASLAREVNISVNKKNVEYTEILYAVYLGFKRGSKRKKKRREREGA